MLGAVVISVRKRYKYVMLTNCYGYRYDTILFCIMAARTRQNRSLTSRQHLCRPLYKFHLIVIIDDKRTYIHVTYYNVFRCPYTAV